MLLTKMNILGTMIILLGKMSTFSDRMNDHFVREIIMSHLSDSKPICFSIRFFRLLLIDQTK